MSFPITSSQAKKFEKQDDVSVNIFLLKRESKAYAVCTAHLTSFYKPKHVNLLVIQDYYVDEDEKIEENQEPRLEPPKFHYMWIKDLARLFRNQVTVHNGESVYAIDSYSISLQKLSYKIISLTVCERIDARFNCLRRIVNSLSKISREEVPLVIDADFECSVQRTEDQKAFQQHRAFGVGYSLKNSIYESKFHYRSYRQERENRDVKTPAEWFVE